MVRLLEKSSKEYPVLLSKIPDPPKNLYYRGDLDPNIFNYCLGVVGSRSMSPYGDRVVRFLLSGLVMSGITIVSGFMYGVDATAHEYALDFGLKTIAVMPCGVNKVYPSQQRELYDRITSSDGLVISEYKEDISPKRWVFPKRNRIVAGICDALLVIEAARNSGSMITASLAHDYGRKVFSVPGSIFSDTSSGAHALIETFAEITYSAKQISEYYFSDKSPPHVNNTTYPVRDTNSDLEHEILIYLNSQPVSLNELCAHFSSVSPRLSSIITLMEIKGLVRSEYGVYYVC